MDSIHDILVVDDKQSAITDLVLPEGVTEVGDNAFVNLPALKRVSLPATLEKLGGGVFGGSSALESVSIGAVSALKEIGEGCFSGCTALTVLDLSGTQVETVPQNLCSGCGSLADVKLPGTVKAISGGAFSNCPNLQSINLQNTQITTLANDMFANCTKLTSVAFPATLTSIGDNAFVGCTGLTSADFSAASGLTTIGQSAFSGTGLTAVALPDALNSLGNNAFAGCPNLQSASLPALCYYSGTLGTGVFANCPALQEVTFRPVDGRGFQSAGKNYYLPNNMLQGDTALKKLDFSGWSNIPVSNYFQITNIFANSTMSGVEEIVLPTNARVMINSAAFSNKTGMTDLAVLKNPGGIDTVQAGSFSGSSIQHADMSQWTGLTKIEASVFANCAELQDVTIPANVTSLGSRAFANDQQLSSFTTRATELTSVANDVFDGSARLETLTVGKETKKLTADLFTAAPASAKVKFEGENVLQITPTSSTSGIDPLRELSGTYYVDPQGVLYKLESDGKASLAYVPPDITEYTVPETITADGTPYTVSRVNPHAVEQAKDLTALTIAVPANVQLAPEAFSGWTTSTDARDKTINGASALKSADWAECSVLCSFPLEGETTTQQVEAIQKEIKDSDGNVTLGTTVAVNDKLIGDDNAYHYRTGEKATYTIAISNRDNIIMDKVVRVYFAYEGTGENMGSFPPGNYNIRNNNGTVYPLKVVETDTPGIFYYELTGVQPGDTLAFQNDVFYPCPDTPGGSLRVWTETITPEDAEALAGKIINPTDYILMDWSTEPVIYSLEKSASAVSSDTGTNVQPVLKTNTAGEALVTNLAYTIHEKNQSGNSAVTEGLDLIRWVQYEDVLDLPDEVCFRPEVLAALRNGEYSLEKQNIHVTNAYTTGTVESRALVVNAGGKKYTVAYLYCKQETQDKLLGFTPAIVPEGGKEKLKLSWYVNNKTLTDGSATNEYSLHDFYLRYGDNVLLADIDSVNSLLTQTDENGTPKKLTIPNKVNESRHYSYSPTQTAEAEAVAPVAAHAGLERGKAWDNTPTSRTSKAGGTHDYSTVTLTNTGIVTLDKWGNPEYELDENGNRVKDDDGKDVIKSYDGNILADDLNYYFYITPADLETMLREKVTIGSGDKAQQVPLGDWLTVTIDSATLCTPGQYQPTEGTEQSNKYTGGSNSNLSASADNGARAKESARLVLSSNADGVITLTVSGDPGSPSFNGSYTIGADYPSLEAAFRAIGYMPTYNTLYKLNYSLKGSSMETFPLYAGQTLKFHILGTYKTTPMMLTQDNANYYNNNTIDTQNTASLRGNVGGSQIQENLSTYWRSHRWSRELFFYKSGYANGSSFNGESESLNEGTLVDYRLQAYNTNGVAYETMSMADFMSGAQVALAPKEQNPGLTAPDGSELPTHTVNGVVYWVLNQPGTYTGVVLGSVDFTGNSNIQNRTQTLVTKDIVVTEVKSGDKRTGLNTQIRWQPFENWGGSSQYTYLNYKALVSGKMAGLVKEDEGGDTSPRYTINNKGWLGDHQGHRLWATLTGTYRIFGFNKYIITEDGNKDGTDTVQNGKLTEYTRVNEKELVTYQITVQNRTPLPATLTGDRIYDALPYTAGVFAWHRGNAETDLAPNVLNLRYICDDGVVITVGTGEDAVHLDTHGGSNEGLRDDYWQVLPESSAGNYTIRWDRDFAIDFPGRAVVKILVDLQFPERPESGASAWDQYVAKQAGKPIYNRFYLDGYVDSVSHTLESEGKAVLYKGVYDTGWTTHTTSGTSYIAYASNRSRLQYANGTGTVDRYDEDMKASTVTYYTVLYNGSYDRLYLSDLEDQLPRGFTFNSMCNRYDANQGSITASGTYNSYVGYTASTVNSTYSEYNSSRNLVTLDNSMDELDNNSISYANAYVTASTYNGSDGRQHIKFKVSNISYDSAVGKYYLNPGQAIRFGYNCLVGKYADTDDLATNTIAMPYYDYYHTGFTLDVPNPEREEGEAAIGTVQHSTYRNGGNIDNRVQNNDGGCRMMTSYQVRSEYGMDISPYGAEAYNDVVGGNWMVSDVTLDRSGITPGLQKTVGGLTSRKANPTPTTIEGSRGNDAALYGSKYIGGAKTSDVINWRVRVFNEAGNGNNEVGGTMTDYTVTDTMVTPFGFTGQVFYNTYRDNGSRRTPTSQYLFTLGSRTEGDTQVRIGSGNSVGNATLPIGVAEDDSDDQWFTFGTGTKAGQVKLERNAAGEEVLTVHLSGTAYTIAGGYYIELCLHTMFVADQVVISEGKYNDVVLRPEQDYDPSSVAQGRARTIRVPQEDGSMLVVNDGIQSGASVMLTQGYTTNAYKTITEIGNASNNARSDGSPNYITLSEKCKTFRYDLFVIGPQSVMAKIVLIDDLPQEGDHSAFVEADKRNSDFKVSFLETDPAFQVSLAKAEGGAETVLSPDQYTLEVSNSTEFSDADWDGEGEGWLPATAENLKTARSVRVVIDDPNAWQNKDQSKYRMASKCQVHVRFNAKIDDPEAEPGEYAWNSFGYRYVVPLTFGGTPENSSSIPLEAQPLNVGIRYPAAPKIVKSLEEENTIQETVVDPETGEESTVEKTVREPHKTVDQLAFAYIVYEGESLPELDQALTMSQEAVADALAAADRKYLYVPVTVKKGTSTESSGLWNRDFADTFDAETQTFKQNPDVEWHWAGGGRYTVLEMAVGDYNYSYDRLKIGTNTFRENNKSFTNDTAAVVQLGMFNLYKPEYTDIDGVKVWDDADNQDGKRPASITVRLYADGEEIGERTVTAEDNWSWRFEHLLKERETGVKIQYQVLEDRVAEYSTSVEASEDLFHFRVTNSYTPGQISVSVLKNWDDDNEHDGLRPTEVTVHLYADGKRTDKSLRLSADSNWQGSFPDLPMMKDGEPIVYTIREDPVDAYTVLMTGNAEEGFVLSNRHVPLKTSIPVQKQWDDQNDSSKKRPDKIVIRLLADGSATGRELILNPGNNWSDSFTDLPLMAHGKKIVYTIEEEKVTGYTSTIKGSPEEGFVVHNTPVVQTGDNNNLRLWTLMLLLSVLGLLSASYPLYCRRRKQ